MHWQTDDLKSEETEIKADYPILKSFLAGSFSGTFSTILFQPLDLLKTRLQSKESNHAGHQKSNIVSTTVSIIKKENVFGLWKGVTPSLTRVIPGVGFYFATLHWLKNTLNLDDPISPIEAITLGITARSISGAFLIPITVVKTRYESGEYNYKSVREALKLIHKHEGVKGLSSGLIPTLLRDAPFSGLYLMFYTQLKEVTSNKFPLISAMPATHFSCGVVAGILASVVTQPADVVKTKMQLYPNEFKSLRSSFSFIYKKYGITGYFKGIVPRMLRRTLVTAMAWTVYEQITKSINFM